MNCRFKLVILFTLFLMGMAIGNSQQLPLYSQYMMNKFLLNPAIAGSDGYTSVNLTAREQWVGFSNAPRTHAISAQTRILKRLKFNLTIKSDQLIMDIACNFIQGIRVFIIPWWVYRSKYFYIVKHSFMTCRYHMK